MPVRDRLGVARQGSDSCPHGLWIIVVDDGSTDNTADEVARSVGEKVTLLAQANQGAAAARGAGAALASGDYLLFLDADDVLEPRYLEGLVKAAREEQVDIAIGNFRLTWPDGRTMECAPKWSTTDFDAAIAGVLSDDWVPVHAVLWRKEFYRAIGGWRPGLSVNDDGELMFRALLANPRIARSDVDRAVYRQHKGERVSTQASRVAMTSRLHVIEGAVNALGPRARRPIIHRALSHNAYDTTCRLYELGFDDLGARCEELWRTIGSPYIRTGSRANRWASALLGPKRKTALAQQIGWMRSCLGGRC